MANYFKAQLTATTPALAREGEDEHTLSCRHCGLTMQLPKIYSVGGQRSSHAAYRQARRRPARLQGSLVHGPEYLLNLLTRYIPACKLRSSDSGLLVIPKQKCTTLGEHLFSFMAPTLELSPSFGPEYLLNLLTRYIPACKLRSSDSGLLVIPKQKCTTLGEHLFSFMAPTLELSPSFGA
ncbi:UNVERIFIED_CONTAM: hypothetical protein FKN15_038869 [Acipenser sinensis]